MSHYAYENLPFLVLAYFLKFLEFEPFQTFFKLHTLL